jgi:ketosteroid isomerase-like protein
MSEEEAVEATIRQWHKAIASNDGATLKGLWDQSYGNLVFVVEENNQAYFDWPSIEAYYDAQTAGPEQFAWTIDGLRVGVEGDGAWAYLTFTASGFIPELDYGLTANGRNSYFLHKVGGEWKLIHYHESLSRDNSRAAWGAFFER